jgi:alpha-L-rhamnosidase
MIMNKKAEWIWYLGDFELYHHMKFSLSRRERGNIVPTFWKVFDCHRLVRFEKTVTLESAETIRVEMDGVGYLLVGRVRKSASSPIHLEAGTHTLSFIVGNTSGIPALRVKGDTVFSDSSWVADAFEGEKSAVGSMYIPNGVKPTDYQLPCTPISPESITQTESGTVYDFGRETYIKLEFDIPAPGCSVRVVYGESMEEVMSDAYAVISEELSHAEGRVALPATACRYARIVSNLAPSNVTGLYEYLPLETKGSFECSDPLLNKIYEVCDYTLRLNSRLFYLDGIKRDGWVWGGDAYQSFFFNYYIHFDKDIIKRTLIALRGGNPIVSHVNTIIDYSLYWLMSLKDYCLYTGDYEFISKIYPRAVELLEYCELRENDDGLLVGRSTDWTFIDWADMDKRGALCAIQMLYCKALESMARCSHIVGQSINAGKYLNKANKLRSKINALYWNAEKGAFVTTVIDGVRSEQIRRHQNLFAIIFGFADDEMTNQIVKNVILNDEIPAITTPYFKFYELEALCKAGQIEKVTEIIGSYWGGMLNEGATTFWEEYDPKMKGAEHFAMYGEPFDKSLCHAWGASPIYLFGRYYLGVRPVKDGYTEFEVSPNNGGLDRISGTVPLNNGAVTVTSDSHSVTITTNVPGGFYVADGKRTPIIPNVVNRF